MSADSPPAERKCYGGLHALDCPHVRAVADAAVEAVLPRIEALEKRLAGVARPHTHFMRRGAEWSNKNEVAQW